MGSNQQIGRHVRKPTKPHPPTQTDRLMAYVAWRRRLGFWLLLVERLWPLILPFVLLTCIFLSCAWFGLFSLLPLWLHGFFLVGFLLAVLLAAVQFRHFHAPTRHEIERHIEQKTGLAFQPLGILSDSPINADAAGLALWRAHMTRMRTYVQNLKVGTPASQVPRYDPHGLRSLVFLSFAIAFAYSFSPHAGRIHEAFTFSFSPHERLPLRIDAWINPPEYTGLAPIYLNSQADGESVESRAIPHGSIAYFRIVNASNEIALSISDETGKRSAITPQEMDMSENIRHYQVSLSDDVRLQLATPEGEKNWFFTVIADAAPQISWVGEPRRALNATLELPYHVEDDYGVVKAWASIKALEQSATDEVLPLYEQPQIALNLPRSAKGNATTRHDFTNHPWAGIETEITLHAEDGAGNVAISPPLIITLPQRIFGNPLARAVVEQRRLLVQDRTQRDLVADMLAALLVRPDDTIRNATHSVALQSAWTRLSYARDDDSLRAMTDYLWQIAIGIEDGGLKTAEERLRQAQQALREALRNGASAQEIERLMQELRQAMQDYIAALAERNARDPFSGDESELSFMPQGMLEQRLQQLEEMAQLGNRAAAEQLLNELEDLLNNLQVVQGRNGEGDDSRNQRSAMQQNMDALADMMRRQQELMNETDRLTQQWRRGERSDNDYGEMMEGLADAQEELRQEWDNLQRGLAQQGMESGPAMGEAGEEMGQARDRLGQGEGEGATGSQGRALEAMRRAGQDMMQAMRGGNGQGGGQEAGRSLDPLGRERQDGRMSQNSDVKLPSEIDIERARQILDEIRARLQYMAPQLERHYLERLLNFE